MFAYERLKLTLSKSACKVSVITKLSFIRELLWIKIGDVLEKSGRILIGMVVLTL